MHLVAKIKKRGNSLSNLESSNGSGSGQEHDLLIYAAELENDKNSDIQKVRYKLVPRMVRYDWI